MDTIPEYLDAIRFVNTEAQLAGQLDPQHFKRFANAATLNPGGVISLRGYQESFGPKVLVGNLKCDVVLVCQRCLQSVTYELRSEIAWGLVYSEAAMQGLSPELDPVLIDDGHILLRDLIEDELLLLLPIVPVHLNCSNGWTPDPQFGGPVEKHNPFAVLSELKISK